MKHTSFFKITLPIIVLMLVNNVVFSTSKLGLVITGNITGLPENSEVCLFEDGSTDTLQKTICKKGTFLFKVSNVRIGKMYYVWFDKKVFKTPNARNWVRFIFESQNIGITGNMGQLKDVSLTGSKALSVYENYHKINEKYIDSINSAMDSLPTKVKNKSIGEILTYVGEENNTTAFTKCIQISHNWKSFVKRYTKTNANSIITPLLIKKSHALTLMEKKQIYNVLPTNTKNSFYGTELKNYLTSEFLRSKIEIGKHIPNFNLTTVEGKVISIKQILEQNKLTLIDFWASWCHPCRNAIPHLKEVYNKFESKGFNIIGIATAKNDKQAVWKKAVAVDQTPWIQCMDKENISDEYFPKIGIPGYLLVDSKGKILASDLIDGGKGLGIQGPKITGPDLNKTLADLLK